MTRYQYLSKYYVRTYIAAVVAIVGYVVFTYMQRDIDTNIACGWFVCLHA